MNRSLGICAALFILSWLPGEVSLYGQGSSPIHATSGSGVSVMVHTFFELGSGGYFPVRVEIVNPSQREETWRIRSNSERYHDRWDGNILRFTDEQTITVPANSTRTADLVFPLVPYGISVREHRSSLVVPQGVNLELSFSGPGMDGRSRVAYQNHLFSSSFGMHHRTTPSTTPVWVGISRGAAGDNRRDIDAFRGEQGDFLSGRRGSSSRTLSSTVPLEINAQRLPADWRGYTGIDWLVLGLTEWVALGAPERRALMEWVAAGGVLSIRQVVGGRDLLDPLLADWIKQDLVVVDQIKSWPWPTGFTSGLQDGFLYGNGMVLTHSGDFTVDEARYAQRVISILFNYFSRGRLGITQAQLEPRNSELFDSSLAPRDYRVIFALIIFAFGFLCGPINFLLICRGKRRAWFLWTTPLLSLSGALFLLLSILVIDGTGGRGNAAEVRYHLAGINRAVVSQEQVMRTGLLLSRSVPMDTPSVFWKTGDIPNSGGANYSYQNNTLGGDWMTNRSLSRYGYSGYIDSRSTVTVQSQTDDEMVVLSSFPEALGELWVIDSDGRVWQSQGSVQPGVPSRLVVGSEREFLSEWKRIPIQLSRGWRIALNENTIPAHFHSQFFARSTEVPLTGFRNASVRYNQTTLWNLGPLQ